MEEMTTGLWVGLALTAFIVGMSKGGIAGVGNIVIPLMAALFGGKASTGILVPLLVVADAAALLYYRREASWAAIGKLIPWTLAGIVMGTFIGNIISDRVFIYCIAFLIFLGVAMVLYQDWKKTVLIPQGWGFSAGLGIIGGIATMIGNAAGPILMFYLLTLKVPKNTFVGTSAWYFCIINAIKLPFHIYYWETISWETFIMDIYVLPLLFMGAITGIFLLRILPEKVFRYYVLAATFLAAVAMLLS
ncbi:MAG: sulfite exporter TauE/SafE family protein [Bacteroidota bacterium]